MRLKTSLVRIYKAFQRRKDGATYICVQGSKEKFRYDTNLILVSPSCPVDLFSEMKLTAFVLAYNLSINPWSHVFTLYLNTLSTISTNPSLPLPSTGTPRFSKASSFLGG